MCVFWKCECESMCVWSKNRRAMEGKKGGYLGSLGIKSGQSRISSLSLV